MKCGETQFRSYHWWNSIEKISIIPTRWVPGPGLSAGDVVWICILGEILLGHQSGFGCQQFKKRVIRESQLPNTYGPWEVIAQPAGGEEEAKDPMGDWTWCRISCWIGEIPESSLSRQSSRVSHIMQHVQSGKGEWKTTEILQLSFISLNPTVCAGQIHCLTLQTSSFSL